MTTVACDSIIAVTPAPDLGSDDIDTLRAALAAEQVARREAEARASGAEAMVAHLKLMIAKLRHDQYRASSERGRKLIDQMELELEELEAGAAEDAMAVPEPDVAARMSMRSSAASLCGVRCLHTYCASGLCFPAQPHVPAVAAHLPRRRWRSRQWKVVQTVREKFTCRACETISQAPAPFHPIARGRAGPNLLAMVLDAKFANHLPLNRQSEAYAREGIDLDVSTLADWLRAGAAGSRREALAGEKGRRGLRAALGACTATLALLFTLLQAHVMAAERLHGDDTTVPVLARGKTITGRLWTYVRDDRPFGGPAPPAAMFYYSRDRRGEHPQRHLAGYRGILQADAYAGFNDLYSTARKPAPVIQALCWAHGRRNFFKLAELVKAPIAIEAVRRIDAIFDIERTINGLPVDQCRAVRQERTTGLVDDLQGWMRDVRSKMSRHADVAKAIDYMLKRWPAFRLFIKDGRICLTNNAAERALRGVALGRKAWLFAGSDRGGERAASMYSLIVTAKLNDVDPRAWLADVLARINDYPTAHLHELLPWNWPAAALQEAA